MRAWLNGILQLIGGATLTDEEYDSINFLHLTVNTYNQAAYDELSKVLLGRENVSTQQEKLIAFFKLKDLDVAPAKTGKSNIYLGDVL